MKLETLAIRAGADADPATGSVAPLLNNVEAAKFIECQRRSVLTHLLSDDE